MSEAVSRIVQRLGLHHMAPPSLKEHHEVVSFQSTMCPPHVWVLAEEGAGWCLIEHTDMINDNRD